jgi:hypothetical protein
MVRISQKHIFEFKIVTASYESNLFDLRVLYLGHAVMQLVEALRYKPECRGFDSRWYHWNFSLT